MKILNLGNRVVNQYLVELNDGFLLMTRDIQTDINVLLKIYLNTVFKRNK